MRPASSILASVLPVLLERTPLTAEKTAFAWRTVVGDAVARATRSILPRLNALLGAETVRVIKVRQ